MSPFFSCFVIPLMDVFAETIDLLDVLSVKQNLGRAWLFRSQA